MVNAQNWLEVYDAPRFTPSKRCKTMGINELEKIWLKLIMPSQEYLMANNDRRRQAWTFKPSQSWLKRLRIP